MSVGSPRITAVGRGVVPPWWWCQRGTFRRVSVETGGCSSATARPGTVGCDLCAVVSRVVSLTLVSEIWHPGGNPCNRGAALCGVVGFGFACSQAADEMWVSSREIAPSEAHATGTLCARAALAALLCCECTRGVCSGNLTRSGPWPALIQVP
jgi:hypothetical protein